MDDGGNGLVRLTPENAEVGQTVVSSVLTPHVSPVNLYYRFITRCERGVCIETRPYEHPHVLFREVISDQSATQYIVPPRTGSEDAPFLSPVLESDLVIGADVVSLYRRDSRLPIGKLLGTIGSVAVVLWNESDPTLEIHSISRPLHSCLFYAPSRRALEKDAQVQLVSDPSMVVSRTATPRFRDGPMPELESRLVQEHFEPFVPAGAVFKIGPILSRALPQQPRTIGPFPARPGGASDDRSSLHGEALHVP